MRVTHLNKGPSGMANKTACGRNLVITPISTNWNEFKTEPVDHQCLKCLASKTFELNTRMDAKKAQA